MWVLLGSILRVCSIVVFLFGILIILKLVVGILIG